MTTFGGKVGQRVGAEIRSKSQSAELARWKRVAVDRDSALSSLQLQYSQLEQSVDGIHSFYQQKLAQVCEECESRKREIIEVLYDRIRRPINYECTNKMMMTSKQKGARHFPTRIPKTLLRRNSV